MCSDRYRSQGDQYGIKGFTARQKDRGRYKQIERQKSRERENDCLSPSISLYYCALDEVGLKWDENGIKDFLNKQLTRHRRVGPANEKAP